MIEKVPEPVQESAPEDGLEGSGEIETGVPAEYPARSVDPTRYGDWEKGGRCIDF
jgi:hypothetical protein